MMMMMTMNIKSSLCNIVLINKTIVYWIVDVTEVERW